MNKPPLKKRLIEVKQLFDLAQTEIKRLEALDGSVFVTTYNELQYVGQHILNATTSEDEDYAHLELDKALSHCWRAISDATELSAIWALEKLNSFQNEYKELSVTEFIPEYTEIHELAIKLRLLLSEPHSLSPEDYYLEINKTLPHLVEKLLVVDQTREILHKELKSKQKNVKHWLLSIVISIVASIFSAGIYQGLFFEEEKEITIQTEINKLEEVQKSLSNLQNYVTTQQGRLENISIDIKTLTNKKDNLEIAVEVNEKALHELLDNYESTKSDVSWVEMGVSFLVGILSSLFVVFLVTFLKRKKLIENT